MQKKIEDHEIPEVVRFNEAREQIEQLYESYPQVFDQLRQLSEEYNSALEAADKAVRARKVTCGPFVMYQTQTKYHAEKLYEEVGRERFFELGGKVNTVTTFELDKAKFEAHVTANAVPAEVVEVVREVSPRYRKPEKISV